MKTSKYIILLLSVLCGFAYGQNDVTRRLQEMLDTGESVTIPPGHYKIDAPLNIWSIGQHVQGTGKNRVIIEQLTHHAAVFKLHRHEQGSVLSFGWRGPYAGGSGLHHVTISNMTLATATGTGIGIEHDDGTDWDGDFIHLHDLISYGFQTHVLMNGIAHLRIERVVCSNATAEQTPWGTGIKCFGATPHSHVMEAVTLSGFEIGADLIGFGLKGNFGDVGLCNIGLRLNGSMAITGGRFEACGRFIDIGTIGPSQIDLRAMSLATDPSSTVHPIRLNSGSTLTGAAIVGASGVELVECNNWYDHVNIENMSAGNDYNGNSYYFRHYGMGVTGGIRARFSPHKLVKDDAELPTINAGVGLTMRVFNSGNERLATYVESSPGVFVWHFH